MQIPSQMVGRLLGYDQLNSSRWYLLDRGNILTEKAIFVRQYLKGFCG